MLDEHYLLRGLDALSRAHALDYFVDGHKGAAIISACYFCRESNVEAGVSDIIAGMIDDHWTHTGLCAPFPAESPDSALLDRIVAALDASIGQLRQAGHNVIFPALALKAFRELPEAITPSRVDGICRLIEKFDKAEDITPDERDDMPELEASAPAAEFILAETLRTIEAFLGRGQGWSGHMLTFGRALTDLSAMGYAELVRKGRHAFRQYVTRTRIGPLVTDKPRPEHPPNETRPLERAYWQKRKDQPVGIGHCFKYPYGFYGLMALARDPRLKQRCLDGAYHIF